MPAKITPQIAAHHEAGHAVIALVLDIPVRYASIEPRKNTWGRVAHGPAESRDLELILAVAGPQAQRRFAPRSNWFGGGDMVFVEKVIYGKRCKFTLTKNSRSQKKTVS